MVRIQVFGGGVSRCGRLYNNAKTAAEQLGLEFKIEKISDWQSISGMNVTATPALAVDGVLKTEGSVPPVQTLKEILK